MNKLTMWRVTTTISLFGLITLIVSWNGWLSPVQHIPRSLEIIILLAPLLYFIHGILSKKYDAYVQVTFPALFYFLLGVWYSVTPQEAVYGFAMAALGFFLYLGGFFSARIVMKKEKKEQSLQAVSLDKTNK